MFSFHFSTLTRLQRILEIQQLRRWEEAYVYRIAGRHIRDWVMTQLALYETKIVDMPQIFLPFETEAKGQTLYDKMVEGKLLLGPGPEERKIGRPGMGRMPGPVRNVAVEYVPVSEEFLPTEPGLKNAETLIWMERQIRAFQEPTRERTSQAGKITKVTK